MTTLTLTPNPAAPSSKVTVAATGVANRSTRIRLNGSVVVSSFLPGADGAFTRTITAPSSAGSYTVEVQQKGHGWQPVKSAPLTVSAPIPNPAPGPEPTPTPEPVPPPTGNVVHLPSTVSASTFVSTVKDPTVGSITLDGRYALPELYLERGGAALDIGPAAGKTATFVGKGATMEAVISCGTTGTGLLKGAVTIHDIGFDGIKLAQAGLFEVRQVDGLRILRCTARNITTDPQYVTRPILAWFAYISSQSPAGCKNLTIEACRMDGVNRTTGFIQTDSGEVPVQGIRLINNACSAVSYAFYGNIAGSGYVIDGLAITDSGYNGYNVRFLQGTGTYRGITGGVIDDSAAGWVAG